MGCALHRDFTLRRTITLAVLDAWMNLTPSLITMNVPDYTTSFFLEARHGGATKELPVTRLDLLGVFAKPFIWHCGLANAGNFGGCMSGRVRFMNAITPAYTHMYQTNCLGMHFPGVSHHSFRLPKPNSRCPFLPNARSLSIELGHDFRGWAVYTDGVSRCGW